jgi:hypothetical protein
VPGGAPPEGHPARCTARRSTDGGPCRAWAIRGTGVCRAHGGLAPQTRAAGARRWQEARHLERVRRTVEGRLGGTVANVDPIGELIALLGESRAVLAVLADLVAELPPERGITEIRTVTGPQGGERQYEAVIEPGLYGPNHLGDDAPHVLVTLYLAHLERHGKIAKAAADAGVAERGQDLREAEAAVIATLIGGLLSDPRLGLSPAQRQQGRELAAARLRALEAETITIEAA